MTCLCAAFAWVELLQASPSFAGHHIPLPCRGRRHLEHVAHLAISREIRLAPCLLHRLSRLVPQDCDLYQAMGTKGSEGWKARSRMSVPVLLLHGGVCGCTD